MRSLTPLFAVFVLLSLASISLTRSLVIAGCSAPLAELPPSITIFYSNESENELYKCCRSHQVGGLSRRASVIATGDPKESLVVDVGNFSAKRPGNAYDEFKLEYQLRAYELMNYSVLNVGLLEFQRGEAMLRSLGEQSGNRLISANVVGVSGTLLFEPYKIVDVDGLKVGVVGLMTEPANAYTRMPSALTDPLHLKDPLVALEAVWDQLEQESDIQVLLSQLSDEQNTEVILAFPALEVLLGGPGWRMSEQMHPWTERGVVCGKVGVRGKFQGVLTLSLERDKRKAVTISRFEGDAVELGDSIPDQAEIETLLEEFASRLRRGEVIQDVIESHTEHQQFGFAGAIYCQKCHGEIYAGWLGTRHSQAYSSLVAKGEEHNPVCLECHTTGYAQPGGYLAKVNTYFLTSVQCESCHGPGAEHMHIASVARKKRLPILSDWKIELPPPLEATCVACHDADNDPHWRNGTWPYEQMVEQIGCSQWLEPGRAASEYRQKR